MRRKQSTVSYCPCHLASLLGLSVSESSSKLVLVMEKRVIITAAVVVPAAAMLGEYAYYGLSCSLFGAIG